MRQESNGPGAEQERNAPDLALQERRILITGAGGFIAGHLAERLLQQGSRVRGLVRSPAKASWLATQGVDVTAGDLRDPDALCVAATDCWAVVHAAAWTGGASLDAGEGWRTNVEGTRNALAAARRANAQRFVYISSVAVYGLNAAPIIDEAMPIVPVGEAYPDSKIAAEGAVRASGLPYVIVRPASTYGPRGGAWTLGPIQHIKHNRLVLLGRDAGLVTPGYIDNLVDGLLFTLSSPAALGEAFNLCDDRAVTYRTFYMTYAHMLGRQRLPTLPAWMARLARSSPGRLARRLTGKRAVGPWALHFRTNPSQYSIGKAQRLLGYAPQVGFDEGMRRTEAWLRAEGVI